MGEGEHPHGGKESSTKQNGEAEISQQCTKGFVQQASREGKKEKRGEGGRLGAARDEESKGEPCGQRWEVSERLRAGAREGHDELGYMSVYGRAESLISPKAQKPSSSLPHSRSGSFFLLSVLR